MHAVTCRDANIHIENTPFQGNIISKKKSNRNKVGQNTFSNQFKILNMLNKKYINSTDVFIS